MLKDPTRKELLTRRLDLLTSGKRSSVTAWLFDREKNHVNRSGVFVAQPTGRTSVIDRRLKEYIIKKK